MTREDLEMNTLATKLYILPKYSLPTSLLFLSLTLM